MPTETPRNKRLLLGGAVRQIRLLKGLTQADVATAAGTKFPIVSMIENGKRQPSVDVMCRLANALGVDLDDISYMANVYVVTEDAA